MTPCSPATPEYRLSPKAKQFGQGFFLGQSECKRTSSNWLSIQKDREFVPYNVPRERYCIRAILVIVNKDQTISIFEASNNLIPSNANRFAFLILNDNVKLGRLPSDTRACALSGGDRLGRRGIRSACNPERTSRELVLSKDVNRIHTNRRKAVSDAVSAICVVRNSSTKNLIRG
eukprot:04226_3